ncbi:MAG: carboxynorspermidine decarboxylase [Chitinophagales bacterium]
MQEQNKIKELQALNLPSPCFVLEEKLLIKNLELLKKVQQEADVKIICALKGFSMYSTFPLVKKYLAGATASSLNEARLVYEEMGVKPYTYCPAIVPNEIDRILDISGHIVFNTVNEYYRYHSAALAKGVSMGLRVNPQYSEITTEMYNPAHPTSRLGASLVDLGEELPEGIEGLHFHVLCENNSYALENVLKVFEEKFGHLIEQCKWINMGGGHFITHKDYNVEHLISVLKAFKSKYDVEVILEPGSAVGLNTGYLVSTVLDIVNHGGVKTAILDSSFTCHMVDTLEMPYKPSILGEDKDGEHKYRMGGLSCLAGDYVDGFSFSEALQVGQKLYFADMIHYTMVKTNTFNGVNLPSIGIWHENGDFEVLKSFGYEDFKSRL